MVEEVVDEEAAMRLKEGKDVPDDGMKAIGSVDPIGDFKAMIGDRKTDRVNSALKQMRDIIDKYIKNSMQGDIYDKALECLMALREACINEDEAPTFNKFMAVLKEKYQHGSQSGFFMLLVNKKVSLITSLESEFSSVVSPKEAE
jgi:ATP-dependent DNA helicase 2 subunit 2